MIFINLLHKFNLFFLKLLNLFFILFFLSTHLNNILRLLSVYSSKLFFPILHIPFFGCLRLLRHFPFFLSLHLEKVFLHFFDFFIVLIRNNFYLPSIIKFNQIDGFLYVLKLLLVIHSELIIAFTK